MFRPLTILCMFVAAIAGWYLYQVKQSVAQLERELRDVRRQTEAALERGQVLRAEWALLNEPERLRQVVGRHLVLEPMTPAQFVRFADLPRRVAPPLAFAGAPSLFATPRAAEPPVVTLAVAGRPLPLRTEPEAGPTAAAAAATAPAAEAAVTVAAAQRPAPRPTPATPAPRPAVAQVAAAAPRPVPQPATPALVPAATPAVVATASSTLGFGRPALPPPVPFGSARAATTQ